MSRAIQIIETESGLNATCRLLDDRAPLSSEFLWRLAGFDQAFDAIHAIWTGPELSCPLPANVLPKELLDESVPQENATSYPKAGEIVLAHLRPGSIKGVPPGPFFDIGIFYDDGGRLHFPFGWLMANVCAEIVDPEPASAASIIKEIRNNGACKLRFQRA